MISLFSINPPLHPHSQKSDSHKDIECKEQASSVSASDITSAPLAVTEKSIFSASPAKQEAPSKPSPEMEQAATKIQKTWKKYSKKMDFSGRFGAWYKQYHEDFVAHAIFHPMNQQLALETGKVMPKEMIFRKMRVVEYESGGMYGSRTIVDVRYFF